MQIIPNNRLSNHYRKKKTEEHIWVDDQTFSSSFKQNMETMKEKTKTGMFYEEYLTPNISFSNNYVPNLFDICGNMDSSCHQPASSSGSMPFGVYWGGLNPTSVDTDGDGMPDKYELTIVLRTLEGYSIKGRQLCTKLTNIYFVGIQT